MKTSHKVLVGMLALISPALAASADTTAAPAENTDSAQTVPVVLCQPCTSKNTIAVEFNAFMAEDAGPGSLAAHTADAAFDDTFAPTMETLDEILPNFSYKMPNSTKPSGTLYGFKIAYGIETSRFGQFSIETNYRSGTVDYNSGSSGSYSGDITADGYVLDLTGNLIHELSQDCEEFSAAIYWSPKNIGKYVSFGLEYAHGDYDATYTMTFSIKETYAGDTYSDAYSEDLDFSTTTNDVLVHARSNFKRIPIIRSLGGKLYIIPEVDLACGYSARDTDNNIQAEDQWLVKGNAGLACCYDLRKGTLYAGGSYTYIKNVDGDKSESKGSTVKLGYQYRW